MIAPTLTLGAARSLRPLFGALLLGAAPALFADAPTADTPASASPIPAASADVGSAAADTKPSAFENSVVKVFSIMRYPETFKPWTKQEPKDVTGSGVVIEGKRILTNAHVVLYASEVQIQANQAGDKISAAVEMVAPGIDLAVLKLDDETFFDTHPPLPRASRLPDIKDPVLVYGYPTGGTSLSITKGIVSRIEFARYTYPMSGLRIQIDAAINPGNSGGPAVAGDSMVGLAFSRLGGAENIGYIIPNEEIELFLKGVSQGHYDGKPTDFDELQTLENPALRTFLKLDKADHGIVVQKVDDDSPSYPIRKWDVITRIGDADVDDQGMIHEGTDLRLNFQYLIQKLARNGTVPMTIIRESKRLEVETPVPSDRPLVAPGLEGAYPPYFVFGPIVFTKVSADFVNSVANNEKLLQAMTLTENPLVMRRTDKPAFPGEEQVVVPSPFFPHKLSKGYGNVFFRVLVSVNGTPIKNLKHLVEVIRDSRDEFMIFQFAGKGGETLVFPRKEMLAATDEILTDNGVRAQASPELLAVWQAKPTQ